MYWEAPCCSGWRPHSGSTFYVTRVEYLPVFILRYPGFSWGTQLNQTWPNWTKLWTISLLAMRWCTRLAPALCHLWRRSSASEKVLNWGFSPHEDQTAEMVLILHKWPHLPQIWCMMGFLSVFFYHKWRNIEISNSILLYLFLLGNGMYNSHTITTIYELLSQNV